MQKQGVFMTRTPFIVRIVLLASFLLGAAQAALADSLQGLVAEGNALDTNLTSFSFEAGDNCSQLGTLNTSIEMYIESIEALTSQMTEPLSLTQEDMTSLDDLSNLGRSMSEESVRLIMELNSIDDVADLVEYRSGLSAMLQLSDDIGTMADRILEMANRILLMADNIGSMADKIVYTVNLQSTNMAFIQSAMLTTQENAAVLNGSLSSIAYNLAIDGSALAAEMTATQLNETNMASELTTLETQVAVYQAGIAALYMQVNSSSAIASHYINGDTLTYFGDLSEINAALAQSIERFAQTINSIAPLTQTPVLSDATATMLRLAQDIKVMGDRIMLMSANIVVMADNIGLMSDQIVEVQGIVNDDISVTVSSLGASQRIIVGVVGTYGL